jgi:pimeloyl-ACP methyl ester carboxylesterase
MRNNQKRLFPLISCGILLFGSVLIHGQVREVRIKSSIDGSAQPAYFFSPSDTSKAVPLLVALHTWSGNYKQKYHKPVEDYCTRKNWAYIHPNFRGPNSNPKATGSELAVQDVLDAVAYAKEHAKVDEKQVFLVGTSGGGYMSLLMAGRAPRVWAGVSSWAPISDLTAWHAENKASGRKYARDIELSCGGPPGKSRKVDAEYRRRSPLTHLPKAKGVVPLDINAGILDGHKGSVPISHSLLAFNAVADKPDLLSKGQIDEFVRTAKVPMELNQPIKDESYGKKKALFRRISGNVRVTIFDGGHEMVSSALIAWLKEKESQ